MENSGKMRVIALCMDNRLLFLCAWIMREENWHYPRDLGKKKKKKKHQQNINSTNDEAVANLQYYYYILNARNKYRVLIFASS